MSGDADIGGGSGSASSAAGAAAAPPEQTHGLRDYFRVLRNNRHFCHLWIAETIDNVGSWLSFVATLELVEQFSGGSGLAVSAVVIIRFLPSLVLAPVSGVVADRLNRVHILVAAAVVDAVVVALLALVPLAASAQVAALYFLLTLQFTAAAFYDPARKALVPVLVPASELHLATTIDSFAWSITGAVGASVGGVAASKLGTSACFLADAVTYLAAAFCAWQLPVALGEPDAASKHLKKLASVRQVELMAAGLEAGHAVREDRRLPPRQQQQQQQQHGALGGRSSRGSAEPLRGSEDGSSMHPALALTHAEQRHQHHQHGQAVEPAAAEVPVLAEHDSRPTPAAIPAAASSRQDGCGAASVLVATAGAAVAEGLRALAEGWAYVSSRENGDVAALVLMKCAAATVWGAVDVLNVRFSQTESMQTLGDSSTTLGFIFATVGFGCFVGPLAANHVFEPRPAPLRWGVAASYTTFFAGFLLMLLAPGIELVLVSTFVRSMGSAVLWVYSTLLMQQRVPNELLGRISALEMALYTLAESGSSVFGGAAFDVLHLTLHQLLAILASMAGAMAAGWTLYAWAANRGSARLGYAPVPTAQQGADNGDYDCSLANTQA